jgi:hypothetical protein
MASRLTQRQQKTMLMSLSPELERIVAGKTRAMSQQGYGIGDIFKSIVSNNDSLLSFGKFLLPYIKKYMFGNGLSLPGLPGKGSGLKLAGKKKKQSGGKSNNGLVKGSPEAKAHMAMLRAMKK